MFVARAGSSRVEGPGELRLGGEVAIAGAGEGSIAECWVSTPEAY
jgi:hypothetical protein